MRPLTCAPVGHRATSHERLYIDYPYLGLQTTSPRRPPVAHLYTPRPLPGGGAGPEGGAPRQLDPGRSLGSEQPRALWGAQSAGAAGWEAAAPSSGRFGSSVATGVDRWVHQGGVGEGVCTWPSYLTCV